MKKILSIILIVALMAGVLPPVDAKADMEGDWEYEFVTNGVKILAYNGSDSNVTIPSTMGGAPVLGIGSYVLYGKSVNSVTIPSSVASIDSYAFYNSSIGSITIPASVNSIGSYAFYNSSISSITIQNGVASIGSYAFAYTRNLSTITIPASVTYISSNLFSGSSVTSVIMNGATTIGYGAFESCTSLTSVTIPSSVTSIESNAFYNCRTLKSVDLPASVTSIDSYAFNSCISLTTVTIRGSAARIGAYAFSGCTGLTTVTIPGTIGEVGTGAFSSCTSLKTISIQGTNINIGDYAFQDCTSLTSVTLGNGVQTIGNYAFTGCIGLTTISIPASVTSIARPISNGCTKLSSITVNASNPYYSSDTQGILYDKNKTSLLEYPYGRTGSFTIPASVTTIVENAFFQIPGSMSIDIPSTVTSIESNAFNNCTGLTSAIIRGGTIGSYAFYSCTGLTSVEIKEGVKSIGSYAFYNCTGLTSVEIKEGVETIGSGAFYYCSRLTAIDIPASVISIGSNAFYYCTGLTSVVIKEGVKTIGDAAFSSCSSLTAIQIPASVTSIGKNISSGSTNLNSITVASANQNYSSDEQGLLYNKDKTKLLECPYGKKSTIESPIVIPDSVTSIESNAFYGCTGLAAVVLGKGIQTIGDSAFRGCTKLASVTIPGNVTSIGAYAFYGCTVLTDVVLENGIKTIGSYAFSGTKLTSVTIPESVTSIGMYAFYSCTGLTKVVLGNGVQAMGDYAFRGCTSLTDVTLDGTKIIGNYAFYSCTKLASVTIPKSVTSIGVNAFQSCTGLTDIVLEDGIQTIGNYAFSGCTKLTAVTIPKSVTSIGSYAFQSDIGLTGIVLKDGIQTIGSYAFSGCTKLTSVTIPKSVTSIGTYAFYNCTGLTDITLEGGIQTMGDYAFRSCTNLTNIMLDGVQTIGNYAFYGCTSLTDVTLDGVQTIGSYAFSGCTKLASVKIPKSTTSIGRNISMNCTKLGAITVDADNTKYSSDAQGMLYNKDKTELLECPYGKTSSFIIADSTTTIKGYAFYSNPGLASINLPASVKTIEAYAFYSCTALTSAIFNNKETTIASNAFYSCSKLTTIYGYLGSTAERFASGKTFIMMGDPITLVIRKDSVPLKDVSVTNELLGETLTTDSKGMVYFEVEDYDPETAYDHVINIGNNLYKYSVKGSAAVIVDFKTLKVKVNREGKAVQNASVSIDTQSTPAVNTGADGVAQFLLPDSSGTHVITVDCNGDIGRISMTAEDMEIDGTFIINIDNANVKCKTITGKALHNGEGVGGVVITATKEGEDPLYARTKVDGSYRFILPKGSEGTYQLNVIDDGDYDKGVLTNTQLSAEPGDIEKDFLFDDGIKLAGTVTNTSNEPLPAQEISATGELSPTVKLYLEKDNKIWTAETTAGGKYQFQALTPGVYKLSYGISGYIYTRNETVDLSKDTIKDIVVTNYSVSSPRNIKYDISVKSPIEPGDWGTVSVRCQNLDEKKYENLILEVEIPDGVVIERDKLEQGQIYDAEENKVYTSVNLDVAGAFGETDFVTFRFMYRIEDGYDKDKVVFTAFAREERAVSDSLKEYEVPSFEWSRTNEGKTVGRNTNVWNWSDLAGLSLDVTDQVKVWDGQNERYFNTYGTGADTSKDYATWQYRSSKGSYEYRRFQTSFTKPDNNYKFSHILSENYEAYSASGAVFPINDEIFMFVYPKGTKLNNENAGQYLAFWGSTQFGTYRNGKFMGVEGNAAKRFDSVIPALKHSDYWYLDGTKNRVSEILQANSGSQEFILDVFTSDMAEGGGMDKFNLVFTNSEIPQITDNKTMPYVDFIGAAHADVFKPTLSGDECISVKTAQSDEYKLNGQSMKDSDVKIYRLDTGTLVAEFHTGAGGYYSDIRTFLPPVAGTYPFIAECTKNGVVRTSNIHVVEVLDDSNLELSNLHLTSATLQKNRQEGRNPFIAINVWVDTIVSVSTTFEGLKEGDTVFYKLSGISRSFAADHELKQSFPPATSGTKDVSVIVMRDGNVIFNKIIGRIYASIDPSGYVYDKHTQKRIEGATVTCYVLNGEKWEVWQAQNHGQVNPLITDSNGRYAWDVPEGVYKVTVEKDGYKLYDTIDDEKYSYTKGSVSSIVIPPPRLDINMGVENIAKPVIEESWPEQNAAISPNDTISCEFNKAMKASTLTAGNITLSKGNKKIPVRISINKTQNVVTIIPEEELGLGAYTLTFSDAIEDYNTGQKLDAVSLDFTVSDGVQTKKESFKVTDHSSKINIDDGIVVKFNQAVGSIESGDVKLLTDEAQQIDISLSLSKDKKNLKVYPETTLTPASTYTLVLGEIESVDGLMLESSSITIETLGKVESPIADTVNGYIQKGEKIELSCETLGAEIRYTTDNSDPTESSTKYTGFIAITSNVTIKAVAMKDGMTASDIVSFEYIALSNDSIDTVTVAAPTADPDSGTVEKGTKVTLSCDTEEATIRYTLDGSDPTSSSIEYEEPITITSDVTIKAAAFKSGMLGSSIATFEYVLPQAAETVAAPTASPASGMVTKGTKVTLSCNTEGAEIRYTLDGSAPTLSSILYEEPIEITSNVTIKAVAMKDGMITSGIATFQYTTKQADISVDTYTVTLDPNTGTVSQKTIAVKVGEAIGQLPVPTKKGYLFKGWYTLKNGGAKITASTKVTQSTTIYAQWEKIPVKDTTFSIGNLKYKVVKPTTSATANGTVQVTAPIKKTLTSISIPAKVTYGSFTFKVESIAKGAFKNNLKLKTLVVGSNVKEIKDEAFRGCSELTKVKLGKNVTKIGKKVFYDDKKLKDITILSQKLGSVGGNTFKNINKKAVIKVPAKKVQKYRELLNGKGQKKTVEIKKS